MLLLQAASQGAAIMLEGRAILQLNLYVRIREDIRKVYMNSTGEIKEVGESKEGKSLGLDTK